MADLFSNALTLECPTSMKNYGQFRYRGDSSLCSTSNGSTNKINHHFYQIFHLSRWPPAPYNIQEQAVEPFQDQKLSQNVFNGSISLYEDVTREEEIFGIPIFNADQYQIFYFILGIPW